MDEHKPSGTPNMQLCVMARGRVLLYRINAVIAAEINEVLEVCVCAWDSWHPLLNLC